MKKILFLLGLLLIVLITAAVSQNYIKNRNLFLKAPTAVIKDRVFKLYIAKTPTDQEIGLSKYNSIPKDYGMLFTFQKPGYYSFWMKKMKFPIDIIYIQKDKIVTIYQSVSPPKTENESLPIFTPEKPSDKVLEINAGLSKKYNFKKDDKVEIKNVP